MDIPKTLVREGFALQGSLSPKRSTAEVARSLGSVVEVGSLLGSSSIRTVQSLVPRDKSEVGENRYSGIYGFAAFPLHTDLAHWFCPPRYLLLRCIVGSSDVLTHVLPWTPIVAQIGPPVLRKAVFMARRHRIGFSGLVRAMSRHNGADILRWDPVFLNPLNQHARAVASAIFNPTWKRVATSVLLRNPGDTVLIDNWRMLHGRSAVPVGSRARRIERVYLSEVFE